MKKLVRYLADKYGIIREVETQTAKDVGKGLMQYSYWFNGGIMHDNRLTDIINFIHIYNKNILSLGWTHPFGSQFMDMRSKLYDMKKKEQNSFYVCDNCFDSPKEEKSHLCSHCKEWIEKIKNETE